MHGKTYHAPRGNRWTNRAKSKSTERRVRHDLCGFLRTFLSKNRSRNQEQKRRGQAAWRQQGGPLFPWVGGRERPHILCPEASRRCSWKSVYAATHVGTFTVYVIAEIDYYGWVSALQQ